MSDELVMVVVDGIRYRPEDAERLGVLPVGETPGLGVQAEAPEPEAEEVADDAEPDAGDPGAPGTAPRAPRKRPARNAGAPKGE
jgi:hypothetical protein